MNSQLIDSVILITSSDSTRRDFGTGFVIHRDEKATYVLTCAHVVRDVGGSEQVRVDSIPATVIVLGEDDGFDLAVLQVEELLDKPQLSLRVSGEKGQRFIVAGHYLQGTNILSRQISGNLGYQIGIVSTKRSDRTNAWDLEIDGSYYLQPGYSGSPVVDETSGDVLGVAIQRLGKGEKGLAISIEALAKIWREMPFSLFERNDRQTGLSKDKLKILLRNFLDQYDRWFFNSVRIRKWGSQQKGFEDLANYSLDEINIKLEQMLYQGLVKTQKGEKGSKLYGIKK